MENCSKLKLRLIDTPIYKNLHKELNHINYKSNENHPKMIKLREILVDFFGGN